jgi:hypothetical protein
MTSAISGGESSLPRNRAHGDRPIARLGPASNAVRGSLQGLRRPTRAGLLLYWVPADPHP